MAGETGVSDRAKIGYALGGVTDFTDINVSAGFGRLVFNEADLSCLAGVVVFSVFLIRLRAATIPKEQFMIPYLWGV